MLFAIIRRFLILTDLRLLWKFTVLCGLGGIRSVRRFQKRLAKKEYFPAFLFISLTNNCNLRCQGCWVTPTKPALEWDAADLNRVISQSKARGTSLFGLLGGEPFLYPGLFDVIEKHPDVYFILFTNGTLITDSHAARLRRAGNVTVLISVEGDEIVSDVRRGGRQIYSRTIEGIRTCLRHKLITGVATSVCQSNIDTLATEDFISKMTDLGVLYVWYYIYRPAGPDPQPELALTAAQILRLRRFIVGMRKRSPMVILDAYWDKDGRGLCPAATGIGHHLSPAGDIEPCPPVQFASDSVLEHADMYTAFTRSLLLSRFRTEVSSVTRGCVLMEDPRLLERIIERSGAYDSSGRHTALKELRAMRPCPGHDMGDEAVPETSWFYRLGKKYWFFGFGAYG